MTILSALLAALLVVADEPEVKTEMIPVTGVIRPGESSLIAVRLELEPGWHVYWENPGDSGLATTMQVKGPEGFVVGPVLYPAPERIDQPGGLVCYGYEDTACLFVEVTAPETLKGDEFLFTAEVQWLVCDDVCFAGEAKLNAKLRRRRGVSSPPPDKRLTPHLERLPQPLSSWPGATVRLTGSATEPVMIVTLPPYEVHLPAPHTEVPAKAFFFPFALPRLETTALKVLEHESGFEVLVSCTFLPQNLLQESGVGQSSHATPSIRGVLSVTTRAKTQKFLSLEPKWPTAAEDL